MNCSTFKNRISEYIDGEAAPGLRSQMERHVDRCHGCAELMRDMVEMTGSLSRLPRLQPSASFDFALRSRLSKEATRSMRRWGWIRDAVIPPLPRAVFAAAAVVVVAAASTLFLTDRGPQILSYQTAVPQALASPVEVFSIGVDRGALKRLSEEESYTISDRHLRSPLRPVRLGTKRRQPTVQRVAVRF